MAPLQYVFVYVSSDYHFWKILLQYVVAICVFRLLPYANPAPHSLQLNGFSSLFILVFGGNTAPNSLQKEVFLLLRYVLPYVSSDDFPLPHTPRQNFFSFLLWFVLPYVSSDHFALQILHHTLSMCLFRWPLQGNTAIHSWSKKVCVATLQMTSLCKSCTTLYAYVS